MRKTPTLILLTCILLVLVSPALAYIGPGAGISVVGSLLSILATFFVAIGAILFWPLRKLMKRRRARRESMPAAEEVQDSVDGTGVDGTGVDGTGVDGTGVDGTGVDGTGADDSRNNSRG